MAVASRARAGRAFTIIEVLVAILVGIVLIAVIVLLLGRSYPNTPQLKDSANIRGIVQGL